MCNFIKSFDAEPAVFSSLLQMFFISVELGRQALARMDGMDQHAPAWGQSQDGWMVRGGGEYINNYILGACMRYNQ